MGIVLAVSTLALTLPAELVAHSELQEQIDAVTEELKREPDSAERHLRRGELHREHEDWKAAAADYDRAAELAPGLNVVMLARGRMLLQSGQHEASLQALDLFLAKEPEHAEALVARARALRKLGRPFEAAEDFDKAIARLEKPEPDYYVERALALVEAGPQYRAEAVKALDAGTARLGSVPALELFALELETAAGRHDAALARVDRLAAKAQRKETWLTRRGDILIKANRPAEARQALTEALGSIESLPLRQRAAKPATELQRTLKTRLHQPEE